MISHSSWGQVKELSASRTNEKITIDGQSFERSWASAQIATDFLERNPTEGKQPRFKTEVKILFDDNNIYVLGHCFDSHPDSILTQLGERDDDLNADMFSISFDTYNQLLDAFTFSVSASGVQSDSRISDPSFNAVWESEVAIVEDGWIAEIKIPYYAIRFPKADKQVWRVQFDREIRRSRSEVQWSLVPKNVETEINYWGRLTGLDNIKDPLRLSLSPYLSAFTEFTKDERTFGYGAGADLKLGLNESFTLDMTLLPDFSQVRSDNIVKNLGAFEVVFEEQRPFFQEGVELFNRGDLFYSRRIGGVPIGYGQAFANLDSAEVVVENPITSKLVNVAKVSGRNKRGLGIGVMNAITASSSAIIENTITGTTREVETNSLVNYNILSLDQNLKNNSSIYFINLSTIRTNEFIDANVSALGINLVSKKSSYSLSGDIKVSQRDTNLLQNLFKANNNDGLSYSLNVAKISGNFKYALASESKSPNFDPNDLGVNFTRNIRTHSINLQYNKYNPFWILNSSYNSFNFSLEQDYTTNELLKKKYNGRFFFINPNFVALFVSMSSQVGDGIDLFESRVPGQKFITPEYYYNGIGISTDYRKRLAFDGEIGYGQGYFTDYIVNNYFEVNLEPIIRVNDKLTLRPSSNYSIFLNGAGFAGYFDDEPKYGVRDVRTLTNILQAKYLFKNNLSLTLRIRHYWSYGTYDYYGDLDEEGYIIRDDSFTGNSDFNFNAFNTDLIFGWQFAPGSFLNIVYKNALQRDEQNIQTSYFDNLGSVLSQGQRNTITMKVVYFFDTVSTYKKLFKKR
ncbi:MAG: DUF5916 domain-containing protein [Crocinitomicaceae bacterium]|nr:DUF5916 domain-containing protein [Crocinitomicaceae bacterium]